MIRAVYPGTFDPFTLGHLDVLRRVARIFPEVVLAVAASSAKNPLLTLEERVESAREVCKDFPNVKVQGFSGLLKDFVAKESISIIVRGVRATSDFEYEFQMAGMNRVLMPQVETVFLTPSDQFQFVSGTFVREIARLGDGEAAQFVDPRVWFWIKRACARSRPVR